ncbi:MAG: ABC transporter permease [Candidatus Altiarchaeota archaeon]
MRGIYIIWLRWVKRYLRSKSRIIGSLGMPLFFLLLLGFGLNPSVQMAGLGTNYFGFVYPGIVAMSVLFVSMFAGIQVIWDKQFGFLKETLVAPISRVEIMIGQTLGGATTSLIQGLMTMLIAFLVGGGLTFTLKGFLIALVFMLLVGISFTALGIAFASKMEDMHGFQLIMNFVIFPIFGLSGALFPINNIPQWARLLVYLDPLTYGVEGIRYGLLGVSNVSPLLSFIFLSCFTLLTIILGQHLFKKIKV